MSITVTLILSDGDRVPFASTHPVIANSSTIVGMVDGANDQDVPVDMSRESLDVLRLIYDVPTAVDLKSMRVTQIAKALTAAHVLGYDIEDVLRDEFLARVLRCENDAALNDGIMDKDGAVSAMRVLLRHNTAHLAKVRAGIRSAFSRMPAIAIDALVELGCVRYPALKECAAIDYDEAIAGPQMTNIVDRCRIVYAINEMLKDSAANQRLQVMAGGACRVLYLLYSADTAEKATHAAQQFAMIPDADVYRAGFDGKYATYEWWEKKILLHHANAVFKDVSEEFVDVEHSYMCGGSGKPRVNKDGKPDKIIWAVDNSDADDERLRDYAPRGFAAQDTLDKFRHELESETHMPPDGINYLVRSLAWAWWQRPRNMHDPQAPEESLCACYFTFVKASGAAEFKMNNILISFPDLDTQPHDADTFGWHITQRFDMTVCMAFTDGVTFMAPRIEGRDGNGVVWVASVSHDIRNSILVLHDPIKFQDGRGAMYIAWRRIVKYVERYGCRVVPENLWRQRRFRYAANNIAIEVLLSGF